MQLVAQAYSSEGSDMVCGAEFNRLDYSDTPEQPLGLNWEAMQEALGVIDREMRATGWYAMPRGPHWYSLRYQRRLAAEDSDTDDRQSLVAEEQNAEVQTPPPTELRWQKCYISTKMQGIARKQMHVICLLT